MENKKKQEENIIITLKITETYTQKSKVYYECDIKEYLEKYVNKFKKEIEANYSSLTVIYGGKFWFNPKEIPISDIISPHDKKEKKMTIIIEPYTDDEKELDEINIVLLIETIKKHKLKGIKGETIRDIISSEIKMDLKWCIFKYKEKEVDINKNFDDIADEYDQKKKEIILALNYRILLIVNFDNKSEKKITPIRCKLSNWVDIYFKNVELDEDDYYFLYENKKVKNYNSFYEIISDGTIQNCFTNENKNDTNYFFATTDNIKQTNITTNNNKKIDMAIPVFPANEKEDRKLEIEIKVIKKCCFVRCMIRISRCCRAFPDKLKKFGKYFLYFILATMTVALHLLVFFGWIILFFIK